MNTSELMGVLNGTICDLPDVFPKDFRFITQHGVFECSRYYARLLSPLISLQDDENSFKIDDPFGDFKYIFNLINNEKQEISYYIGHYLYYIAKQLENEKIINALEKSFIKLDPTPLDVILIYKRQKKHYLHSIKISLSNAVIENPHLFWGDNPKFLLSITNEDTVIDIFDLLSSSGCKEVIKKALETISNLKNFDFALRILKTISYDKIELAHLRFLLEAIPFDKLPRQLLDNVEFSKVIEPVLNDSLIELFKNDKHKGVLSQIGWNKSLIQIEATSNQKDIYWIMTKNTRETWRAQLNNEDTVRIKFTFPQHYFKLNTIYIEGTENNDVWPSLLEVIVNDSIVKQFNMKSSSERENFCYIDIDETCDPCPDLYLRFKNENSISKEIVISNIELYGMLVRKDVIY